MLFPNISEEMVTAEETKRTSKPRKHKKHTTKWWKLQNACWTQPCPPQNWFLNQNPHQSEHGAANTNTHTHARIKERRGWSRIMKLNVQRSCLSLSSWSIVVISLTDPGSVQQPTGAPEYTARSLCQGPTHKQKASDTMRCTLIAITTSCSARPKLLSSP